MDEQKLASMNVGCKIITIYEERIFFHCGID